MSITSKGEFVFSPLTRQRGVEDVAPYKLTNIVRTNRRGKFFAKLSAKESVLTFFPQKPSQSASLTAPPEWEPWRSHKQER